MKPQSLGEQIAGKWFPFPDGGHDFAIKERSELAALIDSELATVSQPAEATSAREQLNEETGELAVFEKAREESGMCSLGWQKDLYLFEAGMKHERTRFKWSEQLISSGKKDQRPRNETSDTKIVEAEMSEEEVQDAIFEGRGDVPLISSVKKEQRPHRENKE